jgi:hypothetical protein
MADSDPASLLSGIRELIAARDELTARMDWSAVDVSGFNAAQDRLAARVPALLAAVEAALELADDLIVPPYFLDDVTAATRGVALRFRAAITTALAGEEAGDERGPDRQARRDEPMLRRPDQLPGGLG